MKKEKNNKKRSDRYQVKETVLHSLNEIDASKSYSYAAYLSWQFEERVELIRGKIYEMCAPTMDHQDVAGNLFVKLSVFLEQKQCKAYIAPCDVRFPTGSTKDKDIYTVLQPDLFVLCDKTKREPLGCIGAPDLVAEVLSRGSSSKDRKLKFDIYQEFGVREYWVINPFKRTLVKYVLQKDGLYDAGTELLADGLLTSSVLPGFMVSLREVFNFWN
ncbi:Uma2 family endonuclease [Pedobacter metabolipauper]|uniref:Uma2 family endonuclease n=1 Tax=Pedobacter metabolipauper TaxID=425513 RepID=A0A4R6SZH4_9SPHI|nr:Uma2 family endonuclease [Pedobacter metabolipauper]TDQ11169.1 Uma2 family endonuclease [Pedobacter metabolipauper]